MEKQKNISGVQEILNEGMGISLQWFPEEFSISQLAETLAALANTKGGVVLIGITPRSGRIIGVKDPENSIDRIFQAALLVDPPLVLPIPMVEVDNYLLILKIQVPRGLPNVYNVAGRYLGRKGRHNVALSPDELRALLMERGVVQFESAVPPGVSQDDLDLNQIRFYMETLGRPVDESCEDFLIRRACIREHGGQKFPTYAALLLFGQDPQRWVPNSIILAVKFHGTSYADEFIKQEIRGTLPEQIRLADGFIRAHLGTIVRLVDLTRKETLEYPPEAFRELLVNAVTHRDYNLGGDSIQIHMFSNRLEIHSPGRLPGPVNLANLLEARFSRNAVIAQVLSDLGFVERLGYGLNRVVNVMNENHLPSPKFEEFGGTFRVTLWKAFDKFIKKGGHDLSYNETLGLNDRQKVAVQQLFERGRITNRTYQDLCPGVSAETIRRDLVELVKKGVIIKVGDKKSTYYILKN